MNKNYKKRWGDRPDGRKCRNISPMFMLIPHIMPSRPNSQVFFKETIEIDELEKYIRKKRREDIPNLSMLYVIMAASARMLVERPALNRFIVGRRIYARNSIRLAITIKKNMTINGEETTIMPEFEPTDTIYEVSEKMNKLVFENKGGETQDNSTDTITKIFRRIPTPIVRFLIFIIRILDHFGLCPKFIYEASPFHSSLFITDVGSLGIDAVYHHLYDFGTTSVFVAVGKKQTIKVLDDDGKLVKKKIITIKFCLDERICDGFYYAAAIKNFMRVLKNPQILENSPTEIPEDPYL